MNSILTLVRALRMTKELPVFVALPIYMIAYGVALYVLAHGIAAVMDLF